MLKMTMISLSLTILLVSCARYVGDFCDIAEPMLTDQATGQYILAHDRGLAVDMAVQNRLLKACP